MDDETEKWELAAIDRWSEVHLPDGRSLSKKHILTITEAQSRRHAESDAASCAARGIQAHVSLFLAVAKMLGRLDE